MCVFANSISELARYLDRVLGRIVWAGLQQAPKKCFFGTDSVKFLGHIIFNGQITMDPKKIEAIQKLLPPQSVHELQQFLGLFQYYRVFIPKFAHIARPMSKLLSTGLKTVKKPSSFSRMLCIPFPSWLATIQI